MSDIKVQQEAQMVFDLDDDEEALTVLSDEDASPVASKRNAKVVVAKTGSFELEMSIEFRRHEIEMKRIMKKYQVS